MSSTESCYMTEIFIRVFISMKYNVGGDDCNDFLTTPLKSSQYVL